MNRNVRIFLGLGLVATATGCPPKNKPDDKIEIAGPVRAVDVAQKLPGGKKADPKEAAQKRPEDLYNPKAVRLFEDALKSFAEMKTLKVFDFAVLEKKFKAVTSADITFAEAHYNLGVIYERLKRPEDAKDAYRTALEKKPTLKQAAENLAVMYQNEGKPGDAVAIYQEILRKYPEDGAARARMAALYREGNDPERAMRFAREALMREPQNLTAYKVMMRTYLDRKNLNMAKLVALRATRIDEKDPELHYTLGLILVQEGDEPGAIGEFKTAIGEKDDYTAARVQIAQIAVKHRDWTNAEEQYRKIVQHDPKNTAAHVNLGVAYKGLGQIDKAMVEYDAAIKAEPDSAPAYFDMGLLMQKHKDAPERAIEFYKKFITASRDSVGADHPVFENIKECEQYLRNLAEMKAAEEKAKLEAAAQKQRDDQKKKEDAEKAKAEEDAKKKAEQEKRQSDAKAAVDAAMKGGEGDKKPAPVTPEVGAKKEKAVAPERPAEKVPEAKKPANAPIPAAATEKAPAPTPAVAPAPAAKSDEPAEP